MGGPTEHWTVENNKISFSLCTTEDSDLIVCQKHSYLSPICVWLGRYGLWAGLHALLFMTALVKVVIALRRMVFVLSIQTARN